MSRDRMLQSGSWKTDDVKFVRMCVDENRNGINEDSECLTSTCASVLQGLKKAVPSLNIETEACDLDCIKQCWKGTDDLLERLTWRCWPRPEDGYLFHACGNHDGWHLNMRDRSHCSPHFRHNYGPVEVQVQGRENRKIIDDVKSGRCFDLRRDETSDLSTSCGICGTEPLVTSMVSGNNGVKFYMDATSYYSVRLSGGGKFVTYTIPGDGGDCVDPGFSQSFNV